MCLEGNEFSWKSDNESSYRITRSRVGADLYERVDRKENGTGMASPTREEGTVRSLNRHTHSEVDTNGEWELKRAAGDWEGSTSIRKPTA